MDVNLAIGIVGAILALVSLFRSELKRDRIEPVWFYRRKPCDKRRYSSGCIWIKVRSLPYKKVYVTRIGFVNIGKKPILDTDVRKSIKVHFGNGNYILQSPELILTNRKELDFVARSVGNSVVLQFDFLEQNDGAIVEVIHTGDEQPSINIEGTIIGSPKGIPLRNREYASSLIVFGKQINIRAILYLIIYLFVFCYGSYSFIRATAVDISHHNVSIWATVAFVIILLIFFVGVLQSLYQLHRYFNSWFKLDDWDVEDKRGLVQWMKEEAISRIKGLVGNKT
jgi:hypothetical protein